MRIEHGENCVKQEIPSDEEETLDVPLITFFVVVNLGSATFAGLFFTVPTMNKSQTKVVTKATATKTTCKEK